MTTTVISDDRSKLSTKSQRLLEEVARRSHTKIFKVSGEMDDETVRLSWNAFGLYVSRQLRMGRGVLVPQFGLFTLTAPEYKLDGVTNPQVRDQQPRMPVFIISKDFAATRDIQSGMIGIDAQVRPYKASGTNGALAQTKVNFTEIGIYSDLGKDRTKLGVDRVIKQLSERATHGQNIEMEIPNVGALLIRNKVAAIRFTDFLLNDTRFISKKTVKEKKEKGEMTLTRDNLQIFKNTRDNQSHYSQQNDDFFNLDDRTINCLKNEFQITLGQRASSVSNIYTKPTPRPPSSSMARPVRNMNSIPFKLITAWIRSNNYNSSDAFQNMLQAANLTRDSDIISSDQLMQGLKQIGIVVSQAQCNELFRILDYDKDGWISQGDWNRVLVEDDNPYLSQLRSRIKRLRMSRSDVFQRMQLREDQKILNVLELKDGLRFLEPSLSDTIALFVAKYLLKSREVINLEQLGELLECEDDEDDLCKDQNESGEYDKRIMSTIRKFLMNSPNPRCLQQQFETYDIKNEGVLSIPSFKSAFLRLDIGLTMNEINRLVRQVGKDRNGLLEYGQLLNELRQPVVVVDEQQEQERHFVDLQDFIGQLKQFLSLNKMSRCEELLQRVMNSNGSQQQNNSNGQQQSNSNGRIKLSTFTSFLQRNAFPYCNESELMVYTNVIDIDGDGWLNGNDLNTFLERNGYIQNHRAQVVETGSGLEQEKLQTMPLRECLYPTEALSNKELEVVMRELRQKLYLKKISNYELFKLLDGNQDGLVTIQEFQQGMQKLVSLPVSTLDGLFAYMDRQKMGLIDYQSLLYVMNQAAETIPHHNNNNNKQQQSKEINVKADENWEWPNYMVDKIRRWCKQEKLSSEDAFRVMDSDFDGLISKRDLEKFVLEVVKVQDKEVTQSRLSRLFKLLDQFKRGQLQLIDVERLLSYEEQNVVKDQTITGGRTLIKKSLFDWRVNAKQQIGIVISRLYGGLSQSFQAITPLNRITFKQFSTWVEQKKVLLGFDLTDQLLQQVFSDIDPHKKGYVTLDDWINAFNGFSWQQQMFKEVQMQLQLSFNHLRDAYIYFTGSISSPLHFTQFEQKLLSLFPDRFSYTDIKTLWNQITNQSTQSIDYNRFTIIFDNHTSKHIPRPKTTNHKNIYGQDQTKDQMCEQVVAKLRSLINSSNADLKAVFMTFDSDGSGSISNLEFKNALRALNLGLTSKEIDALLNYMDESGDGMVNWLEFSKKLMPTISTHLINQRCQPRLKALSNHIHHYLLTPKDAFRTYDINRVGHLTFQQFVKLITNLCQMANEPVPPFSIVKDLFNVIDIRGDGVLDDKEWVQTFGQFDPPETIMKEQGESHQPHHPTTTSGSPQNFLTGSRAAAYFESTSKDFDKVMKILGKNRKYLIDVFNQISKSQQVTYQLAQETLERMFTSMGFNIDKSCYPLLLRFAERDGVIDYKIMLDVYKERSGRIDGHPNNIQ